MLPSQGDKCARRAELGTVIGIYNERPEWLEDDWPEQERPSPVAIIKWPGRKKLTVEPLVGLIQVEL